MPYAPPAPPVLPRNVSVVRALRRRGFVLEALADEGPEERRARLQTALLALFRDEAGEAAFQALWESARGTVLAFVLESMREPLQTHFNSYRHPRIQPAIFSVSIIGPYDPKGPGDTPSRRRLFISNPATAADEDRSAKRILASLMRRAYRRPIAEADIQGPFALYRKARADGDFDAGIEMAVFIPGV